MRVLFFGTSPFAVPTLQARPDGAPSHPALLAGDTETGVATMRMEATLDTGPVYLAAREPIRPDDTVGTLEPRLAALGAPLLVETLDRLEAGTLPAVPQGEDHMT